MKDINYRNLMVSREISLKKALEIIHRERCGIIMAVNTKKELIGIATETDLRQSILSAGNLNEKLEKILNKKPVTIKKGTSLEEILKIIDKKRVSLLPVLQGKRVVGLFTIIELLSGLKKQYSISSPTMPATGKIKKRLDTIFKTGLITNAVYVNNLERNIEKYLGVKHAIAVSNCTSGLMLVIKCLGLSGQIIVPSFTFPATVHAIAWNGLEPVFCDCDRESFNIDVDHVERLISKNKNAIVGVDIFGNPCNYEKLKKIARTNNVKLFYDSAHSLGAAYSTKMAGNFGNAQVFSLAPTKIMIAGEGGIITTNDSHLAEQLRIGRNYGNPGDYNTQFVGLNARMPEFNAILGLESLEMLKQNIRRRQKLVKIYKEELSKIPGISFQKIETNATSTYNYFAIMVEPSLYGVDNESLCELLKKRNIMTRIYFYPPVHLHKAYERYKKQNLPNTEFVVKRVLCLPLYSHMLDTDVVMIASAIRDIHFKNVER